MFHGWSQVSLLSMRAAHAMGIPAILEHPMVHVDMRQATMSEEYALHGKRTRGYYGIFPEALTRRMKAEYDEADRIFVPSRLCERTFVENGIAIQKIEHIPYGVDASVFAPGHKEESRNFRVLCVGRLELLKGVQYLLRAWKRLRLPGAELALIGPVLPEVEPLLAQYAGDSVSVTGNVATGDLPELYRRADVLVFPSLCDAFGLVILEAMACGVPVIATQNTAGPDILEEGKDGFIVPIRSEIAIADRLQWFYEHRSDAAAMGCYAREKVTRSFTWQQYGDKVLEAYGRALALWQIKFSI